MWKQPDSQPSKDTAKAEKYLRTLLSRGLWPKSIALKKLLGRGISGEAAEELVEQYDEAGFFDDEAYALLFLESRREWGIFRLRGELRRRGIGEDIVRRVLEDIDEEERAEALVREWIRQGTERRKMEERLLRRGFSARVSRKVVERACEGEL